jgi:hypothetical protein
MKPSSIEGLVQTESDAISKLAANPWKAFAGVWSDNPDFETFLDEIADVRHEADQAERQT